MDETSTVQRLNPPLTIRARTVRGDGRGRALGYPTINLQIDDIPSSLGHGIFACWALVDDQLMPAAVHYGPRPVFDASTAFEVHLINRLIATMPATLEVKIVARLRDVQNFANQEELKRAIADDVRQTRAILGLA